MTTERSCGSSSGHSGTMLLWVERVMSVGRSVGDVMIRRRVMRRAVGPIRRMIEVHCGIECKGGLSLSWDEKRGRICVGSRTFANRDERQGLALADGHDIDGRHAYN